MRLALALSLALAAPALAQAPKPGPLKGFGDWTVGCDNGRACQAVALVPETDDQDHYLMLTIERAAAGPAAAKLTIPLDAKPVGRPAMLLVDGKAAAKLSFAPNGGETSVTVDRALATALANGQMVALGDGVRPPVASASLKGLAAALLYMDEQQQRLGTVGALRRTGPKPDAGIAAPALPVIAMPPRGNAPPRTMTVAAAARAIGPDNATCDYAQGPVKPRAFRLDAAHSLVVVDHPCGNGAYNLFTSVFVVDQAGRVTPAKFDAPVGMGDTQLVNGDWDDKTRILSSYAKGRGLGDCGTSQDFAWDGAMFRLTQQNEMDECRQSLDYITTWRATVR